MNRSQAGRPFALDFQRRNPNQAPIPAPITAHHHTFMKSESLISRTVASGSGWMMLLKISVSFGTTKVTSTPMKAPPSITIG
jgi:hypothetical protein